MSAVAARIMKRVRGKGRGWVFTPKSFVDFGTRGSVDMALSRLATSGASAGVFMTIRASMTSSVRSVPIPPMSPRPSRRRAGTSSRRRARRRRTGSGYRPRFRPGPAMPRPGGPGSDKRAGAA